jgi:hypothetical protein
MYIMFKKGKEDHQSTVAMICSQEADNENHSDDDTIKDAELEITKMYSAKEEEELVYSLAMTTKEEHWEFHEAFNDAVTYL